MDELNNTNLLIILALVFISRSFYKNSGIFKSRAFIVIGILIDIAVLIWLGKDLSGGVPWIFFSVYVFMVAFSWYSLLYPEQMERGFYKTAYYCFQFLVVFGALGFCFYYDIF